MNIVDIMILCKQLNVGFDMIYTWGVYIYIVVVDSNQCGCWFYPNENFSQGQRRRGARWVRAPRFVPIAMENGPFTLIDFPISMGDFPVRELLNPHDAIASLLSAMDGSVGQGLAKWQINIVKNMLSIHMCELDYQLLRLLITRCVMLQFFTFDNDKSRLQIYAESMLRKIMSNHHVW